MHTARVNGGPVDIMELFGEAVFVPTERVDVTALCAKGRCRGSQAVIRAIVRRRLPCLLFDLWRIVDQFAGVTVATDVSHWGCVWEVRASSPWACMGGDGDCDGDRTTPTTTARRRVPDRTAGPVLIRRVVGTEWRADRLCGSGDAGAGTAAEDTLMPAEFSFFVGVRRCATCVGVDAGEEYDVHMETVRVGALDATPPVAHARYDGRGATYQFGLCFPAVN